MAHEARKEGTAIYHNCYNSRALISHHMNAGMHNVVRQTNGTLYALISRSYMSNLLIRSVDNGFSWVPIRECWTTGTTRTTADMFVSGPCQAMGIFPEFDMITIIRASKPTVGEGYDIFNSDCNLSTITDLSSGGDWDDHEDANLAAGEVTDGIFTYVNTAHLGYLFYVDAGSDLCVRSHSPRTPSSFGGKIEQTASNWYPILDACINDDSKIDVLGVVVNGNNFHEITHIRYDTTTGFGSKHIIDTCPDTGSRAVDLAIARDGYGTLCAAWGEMNSAGTMINWRYATSVNNGTTWIQVDVTMVSNHGPFVDAIVGEASMKTDVIGGLEGGFYLTYCTDNNSSIPKTFVRYLSTTNGTTYTLGDQVDIVASEATDVIAGAKFFKPDGPHLMSFSEPGLIRIAYQRGEGDSELQQDLKLIMVDQALLSETCFPVTLATESGVYQSDTIAEDQLLVSVKLVSGPSENEDFYALGMKDTMTDRYMNSFERVGISCRFLQYEPFESSYLGDRAAYDAPIEHCVKVIWDPRSYAFPTPNLGTSDQQDYIEQDIRKLYLPPDFHISRLFVRNKGNYLKRTVWIVWYDGNEYEVSQVVPHFIGNQITYYEANAYVVGPSRNPFSRIVLPSET
jgi:hypothetical protein